MARIAVITAPDIGYRNTGMLTVDLAFESLRRRRGAEQRYQPYATAQVIHALLDLGAREEAEHACRASYQCPANGHWSWSALHAARARNHHTQGNHRAAPLAERAYRALPATGARPRRKRQSGVDAITERERRIAGLAATGMDNQAIATALFVSRRTVEFHLTHVYRKPAIDGRAELGTALTTDRSALPAPAQAATVPRPRPPAAEPPGQQDGRSCSTQMVLPVAV